MATASERVNSYRQRMRAAGLRQIQLWIPNTKCSGFSDELKRQVLLVAANDRTDTELSEFMDVAFSEISGNW